MMRSQSEILEQIKERQSQDMLGFEWPYYIDALTYENAKEWVGEAVSEEEWSERQLDSPERIKKAMAGYMSFAWEKANSKRAISAQRSVMHYIAWAWLLDDELYTKIKESFTDGKYQYYGKDILVDICKYLDIDYTKYDDGVRENE